MAASWPTLIVTTLTPRTDLTDTVFAADVNKAYEEIVAIETSLGVGILSSVWTGTFSQSATPWSTIKARLDNIERGIIGDTHTQYVKTAGGSVITNTGAGNVPITVKGAASQSVDLERWQNSAGTTLAKVDNSGAFTAQSASFVGAIGASAASFTTIAASSNVTVTGTLTSGALTATTGSFSGAVSATGLTGTTLNLSSNATVSGNVTVTGTLGSGALTATSVTTSGAVSANSVTASSSIGAATVSTSGNVTVGGVLSAVYATASFAGISASTGTFSSNVTITGTITANSLTVNSNAAVSGNLTVGGTLSTGAHSVTALTATSVTASGTVSGAQVTSSGNVNASGSVNANGGSFTGAVTASTVSTTGSIWASGGIGGYGPFVFIGGGSWSGLSGAPGGGNTYQALQIRTSDQALYLGAVVGSSRTAKQDIAPATLASDTFKAVEIVQFRYLDHLTPTPDRVHLGFIAEQLVEAGLDDMVEKGPDGEVVDIDERQLLALLFLAVRDLSDRVESLGG